ncbi:hypothetical protein HanRHA438_Chr15g0732491 [Helianthus annuus]|nr:hypothetical protein HanRHA438_Chr15g0732491 [Helianthus annuus]
MSRIYLGSGSARLQTEPSQASSFKTEPVSIRAFFKLFFERVSSHEFYEHPYA